MPQYILRELPTEIWARFSDRADGEGWLKRALILQLLEDYADGRIVPSRKPPPRPNRVGFGQLPRE
jgi:hypothetical protein